VWAVLLPHRGLLVTGSSVSEAAERLAMIRNKCEEVLRSVGAWETTGSFRQQTLFDLEAAAEIRKQVSEQFGAPMLIRWTQPDGCDPLLADRRLLVQSWSHLPPSFVVEDAALGIGFAGSGAEETLIAQEAYALEQRMAQRAAVLGKVDWLEGAPTAAPVKDGAVMRGEIALVTGAASGIGKACVQSFLVRGAAVVGLDVNPAIESMLDRADFLGIACDLTDEDAIRSALARTVQTFGGLDMLVLNAGIFPNSQRIESLSSAEWDRVMCINLDANLNLMREAHSLLKNAPRYGRVAVNASRNALAPGPGAAAYSVSKMALTQLARVAALEWAAEGIRINMVHPDMVFDTGVWCDEVLQSRAANYHMTVEQYKRRNLLKTELNSHDVSELIVEMCGPLFSKITGAQLPVDGGNDRVI
jgi:NAD(P)-dependent dehydrogenase (short-subunit alcohol dehydrogenase family)